MISLFISQKTWLHRWPAAIKLILLALLSIAIFYVQRLDLLMLGCLAAVLLYMSLGRAGLNRLAGLRTLAVLIVMLGLFQVWAMGWVVAVQSVLRISLMVMLANLVTVTTSMQAMMQAVLPVFAPIRSIGLDPKKLSLAVALMIRFIPVLAAQWVAQRQAWSSRSGKKPAVRLLPAFIGLSLRRSDQVAESIAARTQSSDHRAVRVSGG